MPNAQRYGRGIFIFTYTTGFALTVVLIPLLLPLLFKIIEDLLSNEERLGIYYNYKILAGATTVCLVYTFASVFIAFYQLTKYGDKFNEFDGIKTGFLLSLLIWLFILTVVYTFYFKFDARNDNKLYNRMLKFAGFFAVFSLSAFTGLLMLSFAPTILLLFAYPLDTSALLALHSALFYSTTIMLAVFFHSIHEWIVNHDSITHDIISRLFGNSTYANWGKCIIFCGTLFHVLTGMMLVALLPLTYVCLILLYQFVVARSGTHLADSNVATYVPSITIAVFGFVIKKGAFDVPRHKKMEQ